MESELQSQVRNVQKEIEQFYLRHVLPKVFSKPTRQTEHFRQWFVTPMNYVRLVELPLTTILLSLQKGLRVLDISSPKLLSLYLGTNGFPDITVSDIEDYFVEDFKIYAEEFGFSPQIETFNATSIPYKDNSFDRVFSISVLEHVPNNGDREIAKEVARILNPNGVFITTYPSGNVYSEEWLKKRDFYWQSKARGDGLIFFQRRYDKKAIYERFADTGLSIEDIIFIAEKPIEEPRVNENGRLLYNAYYLEEFYWVKALKQLSRTLRLPLLPYYAYRQLSYRYHYLTRNSNDSNIRQAAVKMRKAPKCPR